MIFKKDDIETLYDKYAQKLYFTSLRITADRFDAEEAMQDAFIKYCYTTEKVDNVEAWLTKVCIRNSIDIIRKRRADELFFSEISEDALNICDEEEPEAEYTVERIKKALAALPDGYRLVLSLYLFEGYDYAEIAQITGMKEVSVRTQYIRGKKRLLDLLR